MNKRTLPLCVAGAFGLLLTSCQTQPEVHSTVTTTPRTQPRPLFIARPGQEAIAVSADTDAAFDQAVASYANQGGSAFPARGTGAAPAGSGNDVISDALSATSPLTAPGNTPAPRTGNSSGYITQPGMNSLSSDAGNTSRPSQPDPYQQQPATAPTAAPATCHTGDARARRRSMAQVTQKPSSTAIWKMATSSHMMSRPRTP